MATLQCPDCGNVNSVASERCLKCGYRLDFDVDTLPPDLPAVIAPSRRPFALLIVAVACLLFSLGIGIGAIVYVAREHAMRQAQEKGQFIIPSAPYGEINEEAYKALKIGMSLGTVEKTIGSPGQLIYDRTKDGTITQSYKWVAVDSETGYAILRFDNGLLTNISQFAVIPSGLVTLPASDPIPPELATFAEYAQVQKLMPYEDVVKILGNGKQRRVLSAEVDTWFEDVFEWPGYGDPGAWCKIKFENGIVTQTEYWGLK